MSGKMEGRERYKMELEGRGENGNGWKVRGGAWREGEWGEGNERFGKQGREGGEVDREGDRG